MDSYPLPPPAGGDPSGAISSERKRLAVLFVVAAAACFFFWRVRDVLPPFLIAFFLAALLDPLVTKMTRKGVTRTRAVLTIYLLVFLVIVIMIMLVVPPVLNQVEHLSTNLVPSIENVTRRFDHWYTDHHVLLEKIGIKKNPLQDRTGPVASAAAVVLDALKGTAFGLAGRAIWLIIIPLALFYFLMDFQALRAKLISLAPARHQANMAIMSEEIVDIFSAYFRSLTIVCVLYGITACIIFSIAGLRYSLFLGLAAGILYAVPYIGPAITVGTVTTIALMMNPVIFGSLQFSPPVYAAVCVLWFFAMHVTFDYGITPRLVGGSVGLHPIVNIFALMCGATLFGVWGMLLAVPVGASVQMLVIYFFPKIAEKPPPLPQPTPVPIASQEAVHQN